MKPKVQKRVKMRMGPCPECDGVGAKYNDETKKLQEFCKACEGLGRVVADRSGYELAKKRKAEAPW